MYPELEISTLDEKNDINEVLVEIPYGKTYPSDPNPNANKFNILLDQSQQKGENCEYYVMNYLRFRYGKSFDSTNHNGRNIEKTFSEHRKSILRICEKYDEFILNRRTHPDKIYMEIWDSHSKKENIREALNLEIQGRFRAPFTETEKEFFQDFLAQNVHENFLQFIRSKQTNEEIQDCKEALTKLGVDPEKAFLNYKDTLTPLLKETNTLSRLYIYNIILLQEMIKQYDLEFSSWRPADGIDQLIDQLRHHGACFFGIVPVHFHRSFSKGSIFGKRQVYDIDDEMIDKYRTGGHAILVVGVSKHGSAQYIYFLDPNYPNNLSPSNRIFKISYNIFAEYLLDVYGRGNSKTALDKGPFTSISKGPFGFYSSNKIFALRDQYHVDDENISKSSNHRNSI